MDEEVSGKASILWAIRLIWFYPKISTFVLYGTFVFSLRRETIHPLSPLTLHSFNPAPPQGKE